MAKILGVRVDSGEKGYVLSAVQDYLRRTKTRLLFTPNPEMLVAASRDESFRDILNGGDLNVCDGFGVTLVTLGNLQRYPGVELMQDICKVAAETGGSVYLLGAGEGVAECAAEALRKNIAGLHVAGAESGPRFSDVPCSKETMRELTEDKNVVNTINAAAPSVLFVALGHGKQEQWIAAHKEAFPSVKIMMGVGGAFDMLAGAKPRAPKLFQLLGLEWLWRLIIEPKRFKRIITAVITFPTLVIKSKF